MTNRSTPEPPFQVAALYRFFPLEDRERLRANLAELCRAEGIKGTLLLAPEGINGTIAGRPAAIGTLLAFLDALPGFRGAEIKFSAAEDMPFHRMKVRLKREIVTMGVEGLDPADAGTYVEPRDWNALIADPGTVVVDTRNGYEVALGSFEGALDPQTGSFRAFPDWVETNRAALEGRQVAMFCTGGIRCEKATAYMKSLGFARVFHLKGGILNYLAQVPAQQSRWRGECFVFDERVSLTHGLEEGEAKLCRACRHPLTAAERLHQAYVEGVSCPHCHDRHGEKDRARFAERQRQVELAERRGGKRHIGG